jgi:hypothetical protein
MLLLGRSIPSSRQIEGAVALCERAVSGWYRGTPPPQLIFRTATEAAHTLNEASY